MSNQANSCCRVANNKCKKSDHGTSTKAIHAGHPSDHWTHSPVVAPLYMTSTFETIEPGHAVYEYSRGENPTRTELEIHLAALESAKHGLAFSSGLGALTTCMFLLESGDNILCVDDLYGGTNRFFNKCLNKMGIEATFVEGNDIKKWTDSYKHGKTKMVWIETPSNPLMKITDVANISKALKNLDPDIIIVVDNTFMTPIFQSPLKLGADIVMHSVTKYINGHSDVVMGALITNDDGLYEQLKFLQNSLGIIPSAFDCNQVLRSIKTLTVRVKRQAESAMELAKHLEQSPYVERVLYPGLKSHPQHSLACEQYSGFGGMLSIFIKEIKGDETVRVVKNCKVFHLAVSLGCVSSLIEVPVYMTHSALTAENLDKLGITKNMIRISIGLEDSKDLINDLDQAFKVAFQK